MRKKVIAILVTLILTGVVVAGCGFGGASEPSEQVIDLPFTWSLESLGYSDLVFRCQKSRESISVEFMLPEDAAQGPEKWYILHLHFSITFSEESEVSGSFPYGRTYVSAGTNGYTCAQIKFINEEEDGETVIKWGTGSENLLGPSTDSTTSLEIEDVQFANYLRTLGVLPGKNVLTLVLEQYDGAKVESLIIFADSGIECTLQPPSWWEEETEAWETLLTEEEEAKTLQVALSDPRVQELLEGKEYTITKFGLYRMVETVTSESRTITRRESRVDILLDKVYEIEYDWPWPPGEQRHLKETVRELDIIIDMDKWEVTGISPFPQGWKGDRLTPSVSARLTEEERERAIQIMLEDSRMQELLQGRNYTIKQVAVVGSWKHVVEGTMGAAVEIGFEEPYWVEYNWPYTEEGEDKTYYEEGQLEGLWVFVHFDEGKVDEITPLFFSPYVFTELELTEGKKEEALQIMLEDSRVQELFQGREYTIRQVFPCGKTEKEITGAAIEILFQELYWTEYDWLYQEGWLAGLIVMVDFQKGRVEFLFPQFGSPP